MTGADERVNGASAGPASGIPARGEGDHVAGCACVRCRGFEPGHELSTRHGAYALVGLRGRALEVAGAIRDAMVAEDLFRPAFAPTVAAAAMVLVRLERAEAALAKVDEAAGENALASYVGEHAEAVERLRRDARGWAGTARGYLADLGLSPAALARIARDTGVGRAARASAALHALEEHVEREYGPPAEVGS